MKTLFVTVDACFPPVSGADLRNWQNVVAASRLGPVLLASLSPPGAERPACGIQIAGFSEMNVETVWGSEFDVKFSAPTLARFRSLCATFQPDAIVLESLPLANLVGPARELSKGVILDLHNIESDLVAQQAAVADPGGARKRAGRIAAIECAATRAASSTWVCSALDRDRLAGMGVAAERVHVVPNGIPRPEALPPELPVRSRPPGRAPVLLFCAHLGYAPNIDAALWLADLMPALWRRLPGARLILAGRTPHPSICAREQAGKIDVLPNPPSLAPILQQADVAVMPLRQGGGTRIKALEAMAWGVPVVATSKAVEGLGLHHGTHVLLAQTADEFVAHIHDIVLDAAAFELLRRNAYNHVMAQFGQQAIFSEVRAGLLSAVSG
jgi:glycosyltransferase involved in cell wall biosynthesis